MVRDYELMYIARPELDDEGLQAAVDSVEQLINGVGGSVVRTTSWGRRRLAYEVDHLRDGHYMLLQIRVDGSRIAEIERALAIHETVFRHLLVLHEAGADVDDAAAAGADGDVVRLRQTAVAPDADDEDEKEDEDDEQPAAVLAANEEEI
jgi:small subunit ribosomal protein S6